MLKYNYIPDQTCMYVSHVHTGGLQTKLTIFESQELKDAVDDGDDNGQTQ